MRKLTPYDLEILLLSHTTPFDCWHLPASPTRESALIWLEEDGIVRRDLFCRDRKYELTSKGMAWLQMILSTPYPEMSYCDPRTGERIEIENP